MFKSILYDSHNSPENILKNEKPQKSDCFKDLNLDQIFEPIIKSTDVFDLSQVLYNPLSSKSTVIYRQEIMGDFDNPDIYGLFNSFSKELHQLEENMITVQKELTNPDGFQNDYFTKSCCLEYADNYCILISSLISGIGNYSIHSKGLQSFFEYLTDYCNSENFQTLEKDINSLKNQFSNIHFCIKIKDGTVYVRPYEGQKELNPDIASLFSRFQQKDFIPHEREHPQEYTAHHINAAILDRLAHWYKEIFSELNTFINNHLYFMDQVILQFSKEVHFYLSWHDYIAPLQKIGLPFCYPKLCDDKKQLYCDNGFDLALAKRLSLQNEKPVTNSFQLKAPEHIIVVTGPNQGGKTTFARSYGQLFYLASLGCCVPGSSASVCLFDNIFTHFNREEDSTSVNGKLRDDLIRLHDILEKATNQSVLIVNEIFSSTTLQDALFLGRNMMEQLNKTGCLTLCVTFLDELALFDEHTVSMMSMVNEADPTIRTYKIIRKAPDGLAYAEHIAQKYQLTYEDLFRRLQK